MKQFPTTIINLSVAVIVALVLVGAYIYFLTSLSGIKNERLAIVQELKGDTDAESVKGGSDRIRKYFVPAGEEALFVSFLEEKCASFGMSCETQTLEESDPNKSLASLRVFKVTLKSSGDFASIMSFLKYLEQAEYPIALSDVNISLKEQWEGVYTISVPVVPR